MLFLLSLLYSAKKDLPKECTLLCGTAVGLLLGIICTELKIFVSTRESIIQLLLAAGKMSIFIFSFPFCYFYLTKVFVSHNCLHLTTDHEFGHKEFIVNETKLRCKN